MVTIAQAASCNHGLTYPFTTLLHAVQYGAIMYNIFTKVVGCWA